MEHIITLDLRSRFHSLNEVKVFTHIQENTYDGLWASNWIEYDEIACKYLIKKTNAIRCINNMISNGILEKVTKGVYRIL